MSTVETVNSGLTHFPMGRGNYLRRAGLPFVRLILAAVLLGGAVSQAVAQTLTLSPGELDTFSFTLTEPSSIQSFTITATELMDGVIVSPPSQFEVSKNTTPTDFQNSISFEMTDFLAASPTVLVRMKAQILPDSVSGVVIYVSTTGVISPTVALTGTLSGWTYAAWTNDADSGINENNYYTHKYALSGSGDVRVNGVTFTSLAGNYVTGKMSFQNIEGVAVDPTAAFTSQVAGSSAGLVSKYRTGDGSVEPMTINLSGLATNTRYELSLYSYSSSANESVLKFYAGTDEREIDTNFFGGTAVTSLEYHGNGMRVIYNYTSDGEGNAQIKIDPATISGTLESFHLGALSNRQVAAAEGDFDCTTTGGKVTINAYIGTAGGVVVIPATIGGFPVTAIGNKAFFESNVTEVFIPFGVTTIGVEAFAGCREMVLISLPSSLASIGNSAFQSCDKLNNVIIPNSVISLGANAFESCRDLANVTLPSNLTLIQSGTFFACPNLATITIPGSVTEIQLHAFMNCTSLAAVYFEGKTRPTVGNNAFSGIAGVAKGYYYTGYAATWSGAAAISDLPLESYANPKEDFTYASEETCTIFTYRGTDPVVWIPPTILGKSVAVIDDSAFMRKFQVTSVLIPPTVTEIRAYAFYHCEALSSIVIPGSVVRVGSSAFSECYALSRITLEPGVQEIGEYAFNATKPTSVTIPSSVNKIEGSAFRGVGGVLTLGLVNFEGRKPPADIDVLAFDGCAVGVVGQYYAGYSAGWSEASINLLSLQSSANPATDFYYTTTGGKVTITGYKGTSTVVMIPPTISGNPVTAITQASGSTAFSLKSIRTLYLPDGLIEIGASTFKNCIGLTRLSLPESLTKIGASAFEGCAGLTSLKLVKNVTDLGGNSFKNCTGLTSIFFERSTPPEVGSGAFTGTAAGAEGYYYTGYSDWSTTSSLGGLTMVARSTAEGDFFSSNVGGFVTITGYRGAGTFVMIPPTIGGVAVTAIGEGAFWEIGPRVTDVLVPDSVTLIGESAFRSQALLTSIILPSGVTEIKNAAFKGCTALPSINLPSDLITIGDSVFEGCGALTSIIIPNNVTTIGARAFFGTTISASQRGLTSVTLGSSVQTIGEMAFAYNSALGSIRIPASVTTIGAYAFNNSGDDVRSLNVFFDGTTPPATIDPAAFSGATEGTVFTGYYPAGAAGWSTVTIAGLKLVSMPSGIFGTSFTVYWASVVGATYTIEVSTTPLFVGVDIVKTVAATASETSKLITGLSVNTNYWYRVTATIAADDTSSTSSSVSVTTGAADLPIPAAPVLSGLPATMVYQQKVVLPGAVSALQKTTSTPTAIPNRNAAGINQRMTIAGLTAGTNYQLNLGINLSAPVAGVLGDLQMYLQHTFVSGGVTMVDQTRMILDRVGVAAGDPTGSLATGLNVIMSDSGAFNIQSSPADSETPLTGTWQPASLLGGSSFGLSTMGTKSDGSFNWNGDWTLVVADLGDGGTMQLDSWSMQLSDLSASDTSVGTAGLEYELVAPTSGSPKASISKNELEALSGTGTFDVRARYRAVDGVSQLSAWTTKTITLATKGQTITFPALGTRSLAPKFMVAAISDSGLPLTYSSSTAATASIDGASGQITPVAVGTTTISAAQAGDENFSPATTVSQVLTIASTPLNPAWGLSKLFSQDSTNSAVAGVTKGTNTYAYTKIEYAEASATAQIRLVPISSGPTQVANLTQTNEVSLGLIGYSSYSNPASFTSYSSATNAVPAGNYTFVGKNASNEVVTNAVVNWSNSTNDYPVQAPQIGGTWVAQSLRLANPANPNTISWVAWTNTPAVGSTNSIRVEVTGSFGGGSPTSGSSSATEKFVTNLPANSTNLAIPAGTLPTNQVYSAKVGFVTMTGGAARSTETQFRMVTGPMNPPASPSLIGALIGNMNVAPGASVVGTLAVFSDLDAGDTETLSLPTFTFPDANDNNLFVLDGRVIKLAGGTFDYATQPFYSILVRATDSYGLYSETTYTVSVQGTQTITFNDLATKTYGDAPFNLTATAPGGTVTYTSSDAGVATISGSTVTIQGAGVADITANQAGGGAYLAATPVVKRLTVNQAASTISVTGVTSFTYDGNPQGPSTSTKTGSTGAVTYGYVGTGGTTYGPSPTKPTAAGSYTVTAGVASDANFSGATSSPATAFTIAPAASTISVTGVTSFTYDGNPQGPSTSTKTGSTGAVTYGYVGTGGTTYGPSPTKPTAAGSYTVTAGVASDANFSGATSSPATAFTIAPAASTISVTGVTSFTYDGNPQGPSTSTKTGSTGAVTYMYAGLGYGPTNTKPTAAGSYTVTAGVASDANFSGATSSPATAFTIAPAASTISVTGVTSFTYDGNPQGPSTSTKTGSTGAVTYGYVGTGGTTYGPSPTKPTAAGSYTVTAGVASDANFSGATSAPTAFAIGVQTLTIRAADESRGYGAANPALTGSVVSGAVLGESFVVTASTTATATSAPGSYSIVPDVTGATLSNYTVSKINGSLTVSSAPFAGEDALTAAPAPSTSTKYSFAQLLLNDSTYAGTLSITGVAAISGVTQGTVSTKGSWVVYVPKAGALAGATDSFNYILSNGASMTMGKVIISLVSPEMTISVALASPPTSANGYKATFLVMPGLVFEAYGSDTVGGAYVKIGTTFTSASNGKLEVTDSGAGPSRFYKLKWLP